MSPEKEILRKSELSDVLRLTQNRKEWRKLTAEPMVSTTESSIELRLVLPLYTINSWAGIPGGWGAGVHPPTQPPPPSLTILKLV